MKELVAKNSRALGICLKLLYANNIKFLVVIRENEKSKIEYIVRIRVSKQKYEILKRQYDILLQQ